MFPEAPMHPLLKVLLSALILTAAAEAGKRSSLLGALLISLPLSSILALAWLYHDLVGAGGQRQAAAAQAGTMAGDILWLVLPSLIFFVALPWLLQRDWGFWAAMTASMLLTALGYGLTVHLIQTLRSP